MNWFHSENIKEEVKAVNNIQGVIVGMKTVPLDPAAINSSIKMSPKPNKTSQVSQLDNNPIHTEAGVSFVPTKRPIVSQVNTEEERTVSPQSEAEYLAMQQAVSHEIPTAILEDTTIDTQTPIVNIATEVRVDSFNDMSVNNTHNTVSENEAEEINFMSSKPEIDEVSSEQVENKVEEVVHFTTKNQTEEMVVSSTDEEPLFISDQEFSTLTQSTVQQGHVEPVDPVNIEVNPEPEPIAPVEFNKPKSTVGYQPEAILDTTPPPLLIGLQDADTTFEIMEGENGYFPTENDSQEVVQTKNNALFSPLSYENRMRLIYKYFHTKQRQADNDFIESIIEKQHSIGCTATIDGKRVGDAVANKSLIDKIPTGTCVSADNALNLTMALINGIKKVYLYNSGFYVFIRPATQDELHEYYIECRATEFEFGYVFGQLNYIPIDIYVRKAGIKLFKKLITSSNLENWEENFEKCLSFPDFDVCLWAVASLMFQNGVSAEFVCHNESCRNVDKAKIDIAKMRFNDYTRLGKEALEFCASSTIKTPEMLVNYHKNILKDCEHITLNDNWSLDIRCPSFIEEILDGEAYVAELADKIQTNSYADCTSYLRAKYFRVFSPFIEKITYKDSNGKNIFFTNKESLPSTINALQLDPEIKLADAIIDFIKRTKISFIAYNYNKCPRCGAIPTSAVRGLIPCDVQQSFFMLVVNQLVA